MERSRLILEVRPELADALRAKCQAEGVSYTSILRSFVDRWVAYENSRYVLVPPDVVQYWLEAAERLEALEGLLKLGEAKGA